MTERKQITQPQQYWAAWQDAAAKAGQSLSAWIADKCNEGLSRRVARKLPARQRPGRPSKDKDKSHDN